MKTFRYPYLRISLLVLVVVSMLSGVPGEPGQSVLAQSGLAITGVQPNTVNGNNSVELVVTGVDFADGAKIILESYGALETTFVSTTVLTAVLPAGVPGGVYTLKVINPDSASTSLVAGLIVTQPTATPGEPDDPTPTPFMRPVIVLNSYKPGVESVSGGQEISMVVKLVNSGQQVATNMLITFTPGDFTPRASGGVLSIDRLEPGEDRRVEQPMVANYEVANKTIATAVMQVAYTDPNGTAYTETFNLTVPVTRASGVAVPTATPTVAPILRPQLVIPSYGTDVEILQPGSRFELRLEMNNVGNMAARRVTMILGGGSSTEAGDPGTPQPGGVSGGSGDFGNFAPVASSNVQFLGDLEPGDSLDAEAPLIVNASANPGAYPMKISFTYSADNGNQYTDDQVITLLVYAPPIVDINFYRDPGALMAGQPNQLPLQVVNLSRKSAILGNMTVTGESAQYTNNTTLVGALDTGGYYTLDAMVIPDQPGSLTINVTIDYTDDFNQPQQISKTLSVEVMEAPPMEPFPEGEGMEGGPVPAMPQEETFMQKVLRFVRGLLGLDSSQPAAEPGQMPPGEVPPGEVPPDKGIPLGDSGSKGTALALTADR